MILFVSQPGLKNTPLQRLCQRLSATDDSIQATGLVGVRLRSALACVGKSEQYKRPIKGALTCESDISSGGKRAPVLAMDGRTAILILALTCAHAVIYKPHASLVMKNTTMRWKLKAKLEG